MKGKWILGQPPPRDRRLCTVERRGKREVYAGTIGMDGCLVDDAGKIVAAESCIAYWSARPPEPYFGEADAADTASSPIERAALELDSKLRPLGYLQATAFSDGTLKPATIYLQLLRRLQPHERTKLAQLLDGGTRWQGFPVEIQVVGKVKPA